MAQCNITLYIVVVFNLDKRMLLNFRFIALKLPQLPSKHQFKREGTAYVYMDSENAGNGFKLSSYSVTDERSAMGATLKTVYDTAQSQSYNSFVRLFYNDQPPFYKDPRITSELLLLFSIRLFFKLLVLIDRVKEARSCNVNKLHSKRRFCSFLWAISQRFSTIFLKMNTLF